MFNGHSGNRIIRAALRPGFPLTVKKLENDYDQAYEGRVMKGSLNYHRGPIAAS